MQCSTGWERGQGTIFCSGFSALGSGREGNPGGFGRDKVTYESGFESGARKGEIKEVRGELEVVCFDFVS